MQGSELNVILWKAFEDLEFRKQFYSRGTEEVLRSHGIPEEQIQTLIAQDIPKLLEYGLVARGPLRWGTFWLNLMVDRARRGKKFNIEDLLRLQEI